MMVLLIPSGFAVNELLPTAEIFVRIMDTSYNHTQSSEHKLFSHRCTFDGRYSSGPKRQSPMQPHTDLDKVWLSLRRNDAMSDKKFHQHRSRVRLELLA